MNTKTVGLFLIVFSFATFYYIFFKGVPFFISFLPYNDWTRFMGLLIYIIVGWCGGVGLPLFLFILGIYFILQK